jgi:hypothetical protein
MAELAGLPARALSPAEAEPQQASPSRNVSIA